MQAEVFTLNVDNTQELRLYYYHPQSGLNWGMDLAGSDIIQDITTPLVIFLVDFPGGEFANHDRLFPYLAETYSKMGLPCLAVEYRGCGITQRYAGHFTMKSALRDVESALLWAMVEKRFTAFLPITAGVSSLIILDLIRKHQLKHLAKPVNLAAEKSLERLLKEKQGALGGDELTVDDIAQLRLMGSIMFWPWFDKASNVYLNTYNQQINVKEHDGSEVNGAASFTEEHLNDDISVRINDGEHKMGAKFLRQLQEFDAMDALQYMPCPLLIQHGVEDDVCKPLSVDMLSRHFKSPYLDVQTYEGHGHGLADKSLRPIIKSVTKDFIKRFA